MNTQGFIFFSAIGGRECENTTKATVTSSIIFAITVAIVKGFLTWKTISFNCDLWAVHENMCKVWKNYVKQLVLNVLKCEQVTPFFNVFKQFTRFYFVKEADIY